MSDAKVIKKTEGILREDLNVTQLGLISIQRKIPPDYTNWKVGFNRSGIESEVECNGTQKYGVPHGIDNDTYLALQELYIEQGCPESGVFSFSMYQLIQMCDLQDTGGNRKVLRQSLERLSATQYWISGAWRSHEDDEWVTAGFRLIEKLVFTRKRSDIDGAKAISVTLPRELVRNIRNGYFKPVSAALLRELGQPSRAAYRVIDGLRHDPVQPDAKTRTLEISLMDLGRRCGIASDRPDKIRRTLEPIHEDLLRMHYLVEATIKGRGKNQEVHYVFGEASAEPDQELVALMTSMDVPLVAARKAALDYPEKVRDGVAQAKALLQSGYRPHNEVGFVIDVVRSYGTGKYQKLETEPGRLSGKARAGKGGGGKGEASKASKQPTLFGETEETDAPRTAAAARLLLRGASLPEPTLADAVELFVEGHASVADLLSLKDDTEAVRTVTLWGARRFTAPVEK